jgi:hypothetical protein
VITIKSQSSPRNATRYFSEHLSHDDYYSEKEQTAGRWYGKTCDAFGIQPESTVEKDQFTALCKGLRPDDLTKLTQRQKENRRCLYDLTASAPKSVSIMALVGGDARLIAAHEKAVTAALEAAEDLARVRVRKGAAAATNQRRATGNLIAARFQHKETNGEKRLITRNIAAEIRRYSSTRAGQQTNPAHKRRAAKHAMPFLMPSCFARRFADKTKPFCRRPPDTINACPRNAGDKISSHDAKKLSASTWRMRGGKFTAKPPSRKFAFATDCRSFPRKTKFRRPRGTSNEPTNPAANRPRSPRVPPPKPSRNRRTHDGQSRGKSRRHQRATKPAPQ